MAGEGHTGGSPRTPSVVPRTCEPKPARRTSAYLLLSALFRAPLRPLSTRAPRQAVLRASFRLAPWLATRPCDLPADKTRDASDRLLPPVRSACTRTSLVPGSLRGFHRVDVPRSLGSARHDRGTRCFTTPATAWADRIPTHAFSRPAFLAPVMRLVRERGRFLPTAPDSIEPLTPLSPLPLSGSFGPPSRSVTSSR